MLDGKFGKGLGLGLLTLGYVIVFLSIGIAILTLGYVIVFFSIP